MSAEEITEIDRFQNKLIIKERDINIFHIIVQWIHEIHKESSNLIDISLDPNETIDDKWHKVSKMFRGLGYSSDRYSADKCRENFYFWSEFYYDELNGNLETKAQQIFDLMKIVHILDFSKLWKEYDWTHSLLKDISNKDEIEDYLNDLENRRFELKPRKSQTISDVVTIGFTFHFLLIFVFSHFQTNI